MNKNELLEALSLENEIKKRTVLFHNWMKNQSDSIKISYAINWKIPHTLFNVFCNYFKESEIQNIEWFTIFKSRDTGRWSNQGKVVV